MIVALKTPSLSTLPTGAPVSVKTSASEPLVSASVALRPLQAAACTYRIAFGPRAGRRVLTLQGVMPWEKDFKQMRCGELKAIAAILEPPVIEKILPHRGLRARAPARGQALQAA